MITRKIKVGIIPLLKDNYSYVVYSEEKKAAVIIDPAQSLPIIKYIQKNNLTIEAILLTHHHDDHTAGVADLLTYNPVSVYSPNKKILRSSHIVGDNDIINLSFLTFQVFATPGHTLDHIVFYDDHNKNLFSGDVLFRLGCGRVFEGTYEQMFSSLQQLSKLDDATQVYCGHEYTLKNLNFLQTTFKDYKELNEKKRKIDDQINNTGRSIPFNLGEEKHCNPFLVLKSQYYREFMKNNEFNDFKMFSYLRDLKNDF